MKISCEIIKIFYINYFKIKELQIIIHFKFLKLDFHENNF